MKPVALTDKEIRRHLFPFAQVQPVAHLRIGILTIQEKWDALLEEPVTLMTDSNATPPESSIAFAANIIPTKAFLASLNKDSSNPDWNSVKIIQYPWHIFQLNDWALRQDFEMIKENRSSQPIPDSVQFLNKPEIFIEPGAVLNHCILNASTGPIYIGKNSTIMEGATIRGPFALCEGALVKMGARIYGATTIGPFSIAGGEIKNSVIQGYSNKAHDGYLGDSVIGEWCNLGAGTSNSNIKNNAGAVSVWHGQSQQFMKVGQKCGLLMGDYSRSAINTAFNTGTVTGICCNVFGEGLTPKYIPNFSWGVNDEPKYELEKAMVDIMNWKQLKNQQLGTEEEKQLRNIFEQS